MLLIPEGRAERPVYLTQWFFFSLLPSKTESLINIFISHLLIILLFSFFERLSYGIWAVKVTFQKVYTEKSLWFYLLFNTYVILTSKFVKHNKKCKQKRAKKWQQISRLVGVPANVQTVMSYSRTSLRQFSPYHVNLLHVIQNVIIGQRGV